MSQQERKIGENNSCEKLYKIFQENVHLAHETFKVRNFDRLALIFSKAADAAIEIHDRFEPTDGWDIRAYLYNHMVAGEFEELGDKKQAAERFKLAVVSTKRLAIMYNDPEWFKRTKDLENSYDRLNNAS